jgi:hypothetical protein
VDMLGEESDWSEFTVSIPRNKAITNPLFLRLLNRFQILLRLVSFFRIPVSNLKFT